MLFELQGIPASSSLGAFERIGGELALANWPQTLTSLAAIQESRLAPPGEAARLFFEILDLARRMHSKAEALSGEVRRESI